MKLVSSFLAGAAAMSLAVPAAANWQYTQWGMTAAQAITASGGVLHAGSIPDALEGVFSGGGRSYAATLQFRNDALVKVDLKLTGEPICEGIPSDLVRIYGGPNRKEFGSHGIGVAEWLDEGNGNDVVLTFLVTSCTVSYGPLASTSSLGL